MVPTIYIAKTSNRLPRRRQAFSLLEVVLASAMLVALTLPLSALTVQSTRVTHFGRTHLALLNRAKHHQDRLKVLSYQEVENSLGVSPLTASWTQEESQNDDLPEILSEEMEVEEIETGLLRVTVRLTWSSGPGTTPKLLEIQRLQNRPTLSLEARFPRPEDLS
jgi:hypothetical protein